ncbi:hypothetical protein C1H46_022323, partial [Malus baccata]
FFSSETRKWTTTVVLSPRSFCFDSLTLKAGVTYNGMLYWGSMYYGFIIGLHPNSINNNTTSSTSNSSGHTNINCRFIDMPKDDLVTVTTRFEFPVNNSAMAVFPFALPWWPTPVTRLKSGSSTSNHVAEAGKKRKANDEDTKVDNNQSAAEDMLKRKRNNFHADK